MLVLVTLGAFAIVSARVNYTFSVKALEWNQMYYALEDKAERYVMEVDALLKEAEASAGPKNAAWYAQTYVAAANDKLYELSFMYPDAYNTIRDGGLYAEMNFLSDTNEKANLKVVLLIDGNPANAGRYKIFEWSQWQSPTEDAGGLSLWDGTF